MKIKKSAAICILTLAGVLLCSCSGDESNSPAVTEEVQTSGNGGEFSEVVNDESENRLVGYEPTPQNGYISGTSFMTSDGENYYVSVRSSGEGGENRYFICKVDRKTAQAQKLCCDPDCDHESNACQAAVENMPYSLAVWDGVLYWAETSGGNGSYETSIVCEDVGGSQHRLVASLGTSNSSTTDVVFCDGKAYVANPSFCDDCLLASIDLNGGETVHCIEKPEGGYLEELSYFDGHFYAVVSRSEDSKTLKSVYMLDPKTSESSLIIDAEDINIHVVSSDKAYYNDGFIGGEYQPGEGFKAMAVRDFGQLRQISLIDGTAEDVCCLGTVVEGDGLYRHTAAVTDDYYAVLYYDDEYNYSVAVKNLADESVSVYELGALEQVAFEGQSGLNIGITSCGCDGENLYIVAEKVESDGGETAVSDLPVKYTVIYSVSLSGEGVSVIYDDR